MDQQQQQHGDAPAGSALKDAYVGFGLAVVWLAIVASVAFFLATR